MKATDINISYDANHKAVLQLTAENRREAEIIHSQFKGKELNVEIKRFRNKRSLNANGMFWAILYEIAVVMNLSRDEVYLNLLRDYGVYTHVICKPNMVDRIKAEWRYCEVIDEKEINGQKGVQILCYFGTSTYDTKEFSRILDGAIKLAEQLEIRLLYDRQAIIDAWAEENEK